MKRVYYTARQRKHEIYYYINYSLIRCANTANNYSAINQRIEKYCDLLNIIIFYHKMIVKH